MSQKSHQILISTGLGILVGAGLTKLYERIKHQHEKTKMNFTSSNNTPTQGEAYEKEIDRQLACNVEFFGSEALEKIRNSFVIIVGIGGVGSHVLSALARAGVKKIRIIDFDRITLSSLNRHAFATRKNVGISKVECCINYVKSIFPHIEIEAIEEALSFKNLERLLGDNPSYVIDCIDNIDSKTDLVEYCVKNNIKIIAACGAGMKADPTRLQIKDISDSTYDDLSRALRLKLKKKGVNEGVPVVYSTERTERKLLPLKEHQEVDPDNFRLLPGYRVRIIPVFSAMPALVGYSIASYALCDLAGHPYEPHVIDETKSNNYQKLYQVLQHREKKAKSPESEIDFDQEDIYILARIFQWKCFLTGNKTNLELVRWDPKKKATLTNLVLLTVPQAQKHLLLDDISTAYDEDTHKKIQEKFTLAEGIKNTKNPVYTH